MGVLDGPNNRILRADTKVQEALEALANHVDHNRHRITRIGDVFRKRDDVQTVKVDGVVFGYRLEDHRVFMRRVVFMKVPGYKVSDISEDERARIMTALFNVFFLPGGKPPEIKQIAYDCLLITHDFVPEIAVERKPGLVSITGGWEKPN
jgi:hypothetical protein